jgi:hypothetical protein
MTDVDVVQSNSQATSSATFTFTTQNLTVGNTAIIAMAEYDPIGQSVTAVTIGGKAHPFKIKFPEVGAGGSDSQGAALVVIPNIQISGQDAVVLTYSTADIIATWGAEVKGLGVDPQFDAYNQGTGENNTIVTGTTTPSSTSALAFVIAIAASYNGTSSAPSETWAHTILGIGSHLSVAWEIQTTSGHTYSFTQATGGNEGWAALCVVIRPSSQLLTAAGLV